MRQFFLDLLQQLDKLAGLKQWERLSLILDPELKKKEINDLLNILCDASNQFPLIPDEYKQSIIRQAVLTDERLIGLNAAFVYRHLNANRDRYLVKDSIVTSQDESKDMTPLTGDARQAKLKEWFDSLGPMVERADHVKNHIHEWEKTLPSKEGQAYQSSGHEKVMSSLLHIEYIKANYDKDGKPLPTWQPEDKWITDKL